MPKRGRGRPRKYGKKSVKLQPLSYQNPQQRQTVNPNQHNHILEDNVKDQDDLSNIYKNVHSIPSYSSKIAEFLRKNETSSAHKPVRRKYKRRKVKSYYPYEVCMADLAFFNQPEYVRANGGIKYVLVFVDVFTKMCYVEPMKDKYGITTLFAMEKIFNRLPDVPKHVITDDGTEFYNFHLRQFFEKNLVNHYSIRGPHKAAVAERMIRTLKSRLEKYFWENKTRRYVDVLQQMVDNYNNTPHRSIGMAPSEVNLSNRDQVYKKLYKQDETRSVPRLAVGDKVRILKDKALFEKGYTRNWSLELYTIVTAKSHDGVDYYKISDAFGNILPRQRYYYELNLVSKNAH